MRSYFNYFAILLACLCIFLTFVQNSQAKSSHPVHRARVRKHSTTKTTKQAEIVHLDAMMSNNEIDADLSNTNSVEEETEEQQHNLNPATIVNRDLVNKMSWQCANNASCLYKLVNGVYESYKRGETVKLGPFDLVKLPPISDQNKLNFVESGRSISTFVDFIRGNAIRIPIGPMVFSVQRAEDDSNYIEVALLKKAVNSARNQGAAKTGSGGGGGGGGLMGGSGTGGGGGLLGGIGGGGNGGGGGLLGGSGIGGGMGMGGGRRRKHHQDKKQFQMYIPLYLAATTFGWTMVAAKAVGLLTLKALALSKIAFIVAASIIVKKLMDNASEKMMYQYPEHAPFMMPYNMDYPMHSMGGELATSEMFHPSALQLAAAAPMQHQGHGGALENYGAESHLHHNIADVHNNTQVLAALNAVAMGQKVKREDAWIAKNSRLHKYIKGLSNSDLTASKPLSMAIAFVAAEETAQEEEEAEVNEIFNSEENIKETLEYLGLKIRKKSF